MLLQFSCSHSVWWPCIQSVCRCYCHAGPQHEMRLDVHSRKYTK